MLEVRLGNVYGDNMPDKANSVDIKSTRRSYHHGDLRDALVTGGLALLCNRSADALSLREVARHAGVSATAVYRHFPDKQALLYAMCERGAEQLAAVQTIAVREAGGGVKGFEAAGRAYVHFAQANPGLYRLMMATRPSLADHCLDANAMGSAMQLLKKCVAEVLPPSASAHDHRTMALHAWSLVHGISMLMLDGLVTPESDMVEALVSMPMKQLTQP